MKFSIIMPVLNEEALLDALLSLLIKQCAHHDCELLIIDGGSTDRTVAIAQQYGRVIHSQRGRAIQMNAGGAVASGDVFIFLHADTQLPADAFPAIESALKSSRNVGGAFHLRFDHNSWRYRLVAFATNLRSRLLTTFTGDQVYFIRATSFKSLGGYPNQPLMEDLEIITKLRTIGKFLLLPQYVTTSARRHDKIGLIQSVFFMWYLRTLYRLGTSPDQLQQMYLDIR